MDFEESIDQRNSMKEFRYHDVGSVLVPIPKEALEYWTERINLLLDKHSKPQVDIWKNIVQGFMAVLAVVLVRSLRQSF